MLKIARLIAPALLAFGVASVVEPSQAQGQAPAAKRPQFIYVLKLAPRLHDEKAWTDADKAAVSRHFERLSRATQEGQVILAGRTTEPNDRTFGLVIFEAENAEAARAFMESDPTVAAGVMTAVLHPYSVALLRK